MVSRRRRPTKLWPRLESIHLVAVRAAAATSAITLAIWLPLIPGPASLGTAIGHGWWHAVGTPGRIHADASSVASSPLAPLDRQALLAANAKVIAELRRNTSSRLSDHDLLAHLRAATLNGQDPAARLEATEDWRQQCRIDKKVFDRKWMQEERELRRILKCDYLGNDLHGRPMLVQRVGAWDVGAVEKAAGDREKFVMLNAMVCEFLLKMPRPKSAKDPRGVVVIMDMEGLGLSHLSTQMLCAFASVARVVRSFYPDILAHMFIVNTPWVFTALKTAIRPLFNADSLSKLHVSSALPPEITDLGVKRLPVELGGDRQHAFPYGEAVEPSDVRL